MKIAVDPDRCQGHARCWSISSDLFDLDDEGHAVVLLADVPTEFEDAARGAVRNCPEQAISIT